MPIEFFYHENNLQGKIDNNYKGKKDVFVKFKKEVYDNYKKNQLAVKGIAKRDIDQKASLLSKYHAAVDALRACPVRLI